LAVVCSQRQEQPAIRRMLWDVLALATRDTHGGKEYMESFTTLFKDDLTQFSRSFGYAAARIFTTGRARAASVVSMG
jgi:hypothetical protein